MNELVNSLQQKTELTPDKAQAAVEHVLDYLKNKLPNSVYQYVDHTANGKNAADILIGLEGSIGGHFGY
jgi:hypothetical protein